MSVTNKPSAQPQWATAPGSDSGGNSFISTPSSSKQALGWVLEIPPVQYFNWYMNLVYQWVVYFVNLTDYLNDRTAFSAADAIVTTAVGANGNVLGNFASLKLALAGVSAGARISVLQNQSIDATYGTMAIALNDIEITLRPGVSISKASGGPANAFNITGSNVRIKGGKIMNFNGVSDAAILIGTGGDRTKILEVDFSSNTTDVNDTTGNAVQSGCSPS